MKKSALFLFLSLILSPSLALAQSVDILSQAETYTHPFYRGGAIWSYQSRITLIAVPQSLGNPANLNYRWSRNGTVLGSLSGVGKNTHTFSDTVLSRTQNVKVEIVSSGEDVLAQNSLTLTPRAPGLHIYENNPLYGFMFHQEVSGIYPLKESEVTFTAFPTFFDAINLDDSSISYSWQSGDAVENKSSVTYRVPGEGSGRASVSVSAKSSKRILETAGKGFLIQFGE